MIDLTVIWNLMNFKQPVMSEANGVHLFFSQYLYRFEDISGVLGKW